MGPDLAAPSVRLAAPPPALHPTRRRSVARVRVRYGRARPALSAEAPLRPRAGADARGLQRAWPFPPYEEDEYPDDETEIDPSFRSS